MFTVSRGLLIMTDIMLALDASLALLAILSIGLCPIPLLLSYLV